MPSAGTDKLPYGAIEIDSGNAFIPDDKLIYFGTDGDVSFSYDATTDNQLELVGPANIPRLITNTAVVVASDALAIPVTNGIVTKTVGSNAEALTLADGTDGQLLVVYVTLGKGGRGTLTPSTKTGWNTAQLSDTGDTLTLQFVDSTVGWIVWNAFGLTTAPVMT